VNGEIIDFEFNHNDIFSSSAEHAEARLVRRIFNLNQIYDNWETHKPDLQPPSNYSTILNNVSVYTSLESCAQCSGIMTLGNMDKVVYLQTDPGQYLVGNIMYNLTRPVPQPPGIVPGTGATAKYGAPQPIDAISFNFDYKRRLDDGYKLFVDTIKEDPTKYFYLSPHGGKADASPSITSFLCTDAAHAIFLEAKTEFDNFAPKYPDYQPGSETGPTLTALTNMQLLKHAQNFRNHAVNHGRRATPHR
jgi:tRNA(Arg) A34 adenosine deaminase TadA